MKFVAVTSCPTGIAHSQMAAENLEQTATDRGHEIDVEVQGAMGQENELSSDAIAEADAVIIAADTSVNQDRFEGKPVVTAPVKDAVNDVEDLLERAIAAADGETSTADSAQSEGAADASASDAEAADSGAPRRGGDPSKGLFARLKRLLS
ncbi:PTS system, fructose-specific, IIB subunnit [Haloterrigena turkmenica DSM 5511]|uniref:PTS system, fructose-specific, IIB subunnit n=1 Tax=Haloterrigena turkmenica (strain ATCC 51198 / DSM 5511 / JCM 9101 / NCIMB 13204 / VKM B-1734 / 4k) TaxID=543526 RepID=D2RXA4_HALTV|nr:PTS fructose transporter subunit IIB [Haloterrigena turkmenica]ADB61628.1 PTS system, fructose-specific, IIB subunnit [Haloterrigena turkmenica DSM 5511]